MKKLHPVLQRIWLKVLVISFLILVLSHLLVAIVSRVSILDSLSKSVSDFDFTDLYYSRAFRRSVHPDTSIILVNIGHLNRIELARLIHAVNSYRPRVIGIAALFNGLTDSTSDRTLSQALASVARCVMASRLRSETNVPPFDRIEFSDAVFATHAVAGYSNIDIPEEDKSYGTARGVITSYQVNGQVHRPFGFEVARLYDSTCVSAYPGGGRTALINFSGYAGKFWLPDEEPLVGSFMAVDYLDVLQDNVDASLLRNKIVLLGYLGDYNNPNHMERFYTPLNERYAGRSLPDMFGVEVHANIIRMILNKMYIWNSAFVDKILSLIVMVLAVWWCDATYRRRPRQFQLIATLIIFGLINLLILLPLLLFVTTAIKVDMRECIFYLIFVPTIYEIAQVNFFQDPHPGIQKQT